MEWLKDKNGALYRVALISTVRPLEIRGDRKDQTQVTAVYAGLTMAGGDSHTTNLPFDEVAKLLATPPADPPQA